ncbi:MAG: calcium/sodium antiporter [Candidatus Altiarchaeota archaeon]
MILALSFFMVGLVFLVKGADVFVESAARLARIIGVSELVVGLTIIAIGTSLPELSASVVAASTGNPELALGNVLGSNAANIGLILGITAFFLVIAVDEVLFWRDGVIMLGLTLVTALLALDGILTQFDGLVLLVIFVLYIVILFKLQPRFKHLYHFHEFFRDFLAMDPTFLRKLHLPSAKQGVGKEFGLILLGGMAVLMGAHLLVEGAISIALFFSLPQSLVGFTIVAVGTSLPELMVAVTSMRKGYANIVVGNVIGSNIANLGVVLGLAAFVAPIKVHQDVLSSTLPFLILLSVLSLVFLKSGWKLEKIEGIIILILYLGFMAWTIL